MKKIITLLLVAAMATAASITTSAVDVTGRTADIEIEAISTAPKIDGKFSEEEWGSSPISSFTKEDRAAYLSLCAADRPELLESDDLLPTAMDTYLRWDDNYLYYCSVVETKATYNATAEGNDAAVWQGTSFIWMTLSDKAVTDSITKILVGMNNDGKILAYNESVENGTSLEVGGKPAYSDIAISRENGVTVYETKFAWSDITPEGAKRMAGDEFIFYSLYMPAIDDTANPVDVAIGGINDDGKYLYWNVTLGDEIVVETEAETEAVAEVVDTAAETTTATAPQTFDASVIAAVAAIVSAAGYMVSKKH